MRHRPSGPAGERSGRHGTAEGGRAPNEER
jgi:hypothetical protein